MLFTPLAYKADVACLEKGTNKCNLNTYCQLFYTKVLYSLFPPIIDENLLPMFLPTIDIITLKNLDK